MSDYPDSVTPLTPVFVETLLMEGQDLVYPVTVLDLNRWINEPVFILGQESLVLVLRTTSINGEIYPVDPEDFSPEEREHLGSMIAIGGTQDEFSAILSELAARAAITSYSFSGAQSLGAPSKLFLSLYAPEDIFAADVPDIFLMVDGAPQIISGLDAIDRMTRVYRATMEHVQRSSVVVDEDADFGPTTLDDAQIHHIEEEASVYPWIKGLTIATRTTESNSFNIVFFEVDDPSDERFEELRHIINKLQNDLDLQALAYSFDPIAHPYAQPQVTSPQVQQSGNGLRDPEPREIDKAGFGPHGLTNAQVDQLNEILTQHEWAISARVDSKKIDGEEKTYIIVGVEKESPLTGLRQNELLEEIRSGVKGINLGSVGIEKAVDGNKIIPYSDRWIGR